MDRLTSGVLILSKTLRGVKQFERQLLAKEVKKHYVCRVIGEFPEGETTVSQPLARIQGKIGLTAVDPKGKQSVTVFRRLSYNGRTSVVDCRPITGRTHQIRVHLQFLGHAIANDPLYYRPSISSDFGKGGMTRAERDQIMDLFEIKVKKEGEVEREPNLDASDVMSLCQECAHPNPDPLPSDLILWLHAYKYSGPEFCFEASQPSWARDDYDDTKGTLKPEYFNDWLSRNNMIDLDR